MMDIVSPERRSQIMRAICRENTAPEMLVRKAAHRLGLRFRLHVKPLPGRPDLVLPKWRTVIFVNGCFWHRHPGCKRTTIPKSNTEFWQRKFAANVQRDQINYARLEESGWRVLIVWQCQIRSVEDAMNILKPYFQCSKQKSLNNK